MGYRVKGTLKLPDGGSAQGLKVEFTAGSTSQTVLAGTKYTMAVGADGVYDVDLEFGSYSVLGYVDGAYPLSMGAVVVDATTETGQTLTQLLGGTSDVPAAWVAQIELWLAQSKAEADRAKSEADRAKSEADRAKEIANLDTVEDAVALSAAPFPDVWIPFNDSLNMLAGYGTEIKVGTDVVARKVDYTRASTATYIDKSGVLRTAAINEPRFEKEGLLIEGQSTNLITTSASLATSAVTVAAGSYTLSFYGTGSVTLSGAATGVLTGTAADKRVSLTVTTVAGALTLTVTGACSNAQLEALPFATSYIPTSGAAATRAGDKCSIVAAGNRMSSMEYTAAFACDILGLNNQISPNRVIDFDNDSTESRYYIGVELNRAPAVRFGENRVNDSKDFKGGVLAIMVDGGDFHGYVNGVRFGSSRTTTIQPSPNNRISFLVNTALNMPSFGHIRNLRIWHTALSDAQIKGLK